MIWSAWVGFRAPFSSSPLLDSGLLRTPCSAALCTALSKKVVEVSLVVTSPRLRVCWSCPGRLRRERNVARRLCLHEGLGFVEPTCGEGKQSAALCCLMRAL